MESKIIRVKRDDVYSHWKAGRDKKGPNRIPWDVYYIVPRLDPEKLGRMFKQAFVIFPSEALARLIYVEIGIKTWTESFSAEDLISHRFCIVVPTYVLSNTFYAYQYTRHTAHSRNTTMGDTGLGDMKYLEGNSFTTPCLHCRRAAYHLTNYCSPGTDICIQTFWRTNEQSA